jgi:hypothetical protein
LKNDERRPVRVYSKALVEQNEKPSRRQDRVPSGEFVRRFFSGIGSAGGHRAMAKAVVPIQSFRAKFGDVDGSDIAARLHELVAQFLHDTKDVKTQKGELPHL